jgi:hypothetical protein
MYICSVWRQLTFYRVTIPEGAYVQLRRRPPEDEQGNARNMVEDFNKYIICK